MVLQQVFLQKKNKNITKELYKILLESEQEIPTWLQKEISYKKEYGSSSGNGFTKRGGKFNKFGSRDYRKKQTKTTFSNGYSQNENYYYKNKGTPVDKETKELSKW